MFFLFFPSFVKLEMLMCFARSPSTPVGLQFEKFIIPDNIRILDAILETLAF